MAVVLEHYIVTQCDTIEGAIYDLSRLICGEQVMRSRGMMQPLSNMIKAPNIFWEWYDNATPSNHSLISFDDYETPTIECRQV